MGQALNFPHVSTLVRGYSCRPLCRAEKSRKSSEDVAQPLGLLFHGVSLPSMYNVSLRAGETGLEELLVKRIQRAISQCSKHY